jgi:hypothetical protein
MKNSFAVSGVLILGFGLVTGLLLDGSVNARQKQDSTRVLTVKQMMSGLVKPHKAALETALKEEPTGEEAWDALLLNAALLNESGYLLMDDERCPDKVWADAAQTLRDESVTLLAALKAHDYDASTASFKTLTTACASCHKAHLKK